MKNIKRFIFSKNLMISLVLACVVAVLAVFVYSTTLKKAPIKIGVVFDITGQSNLGVSARNAIEMAIDEINSKGGINGRLIEPIIRDDKGNSVEAKIIDMEFVQQNIPVIVGHLLTSTALEGMKVVNGTNTIMISPTVSSTLLSDKDDNFLRVSEDIRYSSEMTAAKAFVDVSGGEMSLIFESKNRTYSEDVCKYFKNKYSNLGGKIALEDNYETKPSIKFTELVDKIIAAKSKGVLFVGPALDTAIFCQTIRKQGSKIPVYAGMWAMTDDLLLNGGKETEGLFLPGVVDKDSQRPEYIQFRANYMKRYHVEPTFVSNFSYETIKLLEEVFGKTDNITGTNIKKTIIEIGNFNGLQSDYTINKYGDTTRGYMGFRVENGVFKREK